MIYLGKLERPAAGRKCLTSVGRALRRQNIANVQCLAERLRLLPADVRAALEHWVACGRVELLRPWRWHSDPDDQLDYYRWRQPTDGDHLWEQNICGSRLGGGHFCPHAFVLERAAARNRPSP